MAERKKRLPYVATPEIMANRNQGELITLYNGRVDESRHGVRMIIRALEVGGDADNIQTSCTFELIVGREKAIATALITTSIFDFFFNAGTDFVPIEKVIESSLVSRNRDEGYENFALVLESDHDFLLIFVSIASSGIHINAEFFADARYPRNKSPLAGEWNRDQDDHDNDHGDDQDDQDNNDGRG